MRWVFNLLRKREVERSDTGEFEKRRSDVMNNLTQMRWKIVPQNRSRMTERSICYFKTRGERRAIKGDKRGTPSTTM